MSKKTANNELAAEKIAEQEAEASAFDTTTTADLVDEEAEKAAIVQEGADTDAVVSAEEAAIHSDNESAKALNKKSTKTSEKSEKSDSSKKVKKSTRSAKYTKSIEHVELGKQYVLGEAIELVKKTSYTKFDGSVELHLRLTKKKAKGGNESSKATVQLPHGTGKTKKIIMLDEAKIEEIAKTKRIDFDVALATPDLMPKVAKIAKILGPKGKMPDPKSGTVTTDAKKTIEEINSGKIEYRIDASNNIHQLVGKVSWETVKLEENIQALLGTLPKSKIAAAYLTASMGPSVTLDLAFLK